jgi:hypothetical protein
MLVIAVLAFVGCLAPASADALTLFTVGKTGEFRSPAGGEPSALVRVGRDRALTALVDPTCPTTSSVRFALSRTGADFEDHVEISLPCASWRAVRGGFRYRASEPAPGGVREIVYGGRRVLIRAGGSGFAPIAGPVAYVEAWLTIGSARHLVRFQNFRRNDGERVVTRRPSRVAGEGEAAFWDTVWADRPRSDEALKLLRRAVRRDPRDGRSQFLLGMLHLYRSTLACAEFDFRALCDAAKAEGLAAQEPLDRAAELLARDTRIPGFRAATTYANGFVQNDPARLALGMQQIEAAVDANPLFNSFDAFAVVAPILPASDRYYQDRILPLVDFVFRDNPSCPFTLPEICNNVGMAPHNIEGTVLLLGDIYAKGGRLADAQLWYSFGRVIGAGSGYRYQAYLDDRVANAAARVALYQDGDPSNDPPLIGGGGSCIYCHNK